MLARLLAFVAAIIDRVVPAKPIRPYEDQATALINRIDADARVALDHSVALTEAAATLIVKSQSTRDYSRKLSSLAGRLEGALTAK
ncbi:hypothetical protein SAMN02983003_0632 [Devosia enhydra]|uniref:Uncharacterized protein n=1 Tax=Devosia enhydra TaxID=665118 RepID=A0A1K2HTU9_9HYPH|nr:hypothetical protein [Devosia enhydra]SFZ81682.1 hypothetical protein SAMN02983003_0632 [Devosia enhydra]